MPPKEMTNEQLTDAFFEALKESTTKEQHEQLESLTEEMRERRIVGEA